MAHPATNDVDVDLGRLFSSIARDWRRILGVALVVALLAYALTLVLTRHYMGETRILIETSESDFTRRDTTTDRSAATLDEEGVTSQVEVITSGDLLMKVASDLNLASLDEFTDGENSLLSRVLMMTGLRADPGPLARDQRVLRTMREKLDVYRVERSRVIVIEFSSEDPQLAARVPNAIADAYIELQRGAKLQSNSAATGWLEPEIADLRERVREAEAKVAAYRGQSGLLIGQNNSVLATQQLSELSTELSRVRANRSTAEANAQSVRAALDNGASLDAIPDVLASTLIQRLREREVELRAQIADLSTTLLENHPQLRALRSQLSDLDQQIRGEARKVLASLQNEAANARAREESLIADLNGLKAASAQADEDSVELRALEREATAQRELLESYLTRYREASSRAEANYLPADARIFSRATAPTLPYFPKTVPIVGSALAAALLLMVIFTLLRELFSGRAMVQAGRPQIEVDEIRMPEPVHADMDDTVIPQREVAAPAPVIVAERPVFVEPAQPNAAQEAPIATRAMPVMQSPTPVAPPPLRQPVMQRSPAEEQAFEELEPTIGEIDVSLAAERLIASGAQRAIVISPEGDDAAAASVLIAREIADAGLRVILLDLTASGAASRPMLESSAFKGITNLLCSEAQFADVIHADVYSESHIIPVGTANAGKAMRAAERLPIILQSLTTAYDIVVVECGAAGVEAIERLVDDESEIIVSAIEPSQMIADAADEVREGGLRKPMIVAAAGGDYRPYGSGRSAA